MSTYKEIFQEIESSKDKRKISNLLNSLIRKKPDYLVIHLITSLPLILFIVFKFETKLILRISGTPRLNIFRKILWKLSKKNIDFITVPTKETLAT